MADFTDAKSALGALYPVNMTESPWLRSEPLLTPARIRTQFLFGVPLVSGIKDPFTGKPQIMTDEIIKDVIERAVSIVEMETGIDIMPMKRVEKHPFDLKLYQSFGFLKLEHRPVSTIFTFSVTPSNGVSVYSIPLDWVEVAYLPYGQINIVPLTIATGNGGFIPSASSGGAAFLSILGQQAWIPAYWQIEYASGFPDGNIPKIFNELIGIQASMEILSMLSASNAKSTSHSIGIDGLSQSQGGPGPNTYDNRIKDLTEKKLMLIQKVKKLFGISMFVGNI